MIDTAPVKERKTNARPTQTYLTETQCRSHAGEPIEATDLYDAATQCPDGFVVVGVRTG